MKLPKPSSCPSIVNPWVWPQVLSHVLGGDFERLASTLGELGGRKRAPAHQQERYIILSVRWFIWSTDSTAVSYGLDVNLLAWSSHPIIGQPRGRLPENTRFGKFVNGALCFWQMKVGSPDQIIRSDRCVTVWRSTGEHYQVCNIVQHDRFGCGSVMVQGVIPRRTYGPACA